jgi:hypothetical protein
VGLAREVDQDAIMGDRETVTIGHTMQVRDTAELIGRKWAAVDIRLET